MSLRLLISAVFALGIILPGFAVITGDEESIACDNTVLNTYEGRAAFGAVWYPDCAPGQYLPENSDACVKCLADSYCSGGAIRIEGLADRDYGIVRCANGLHAQAGSRTADDCGRILHIGDSNLYLHKDKRTTPSLIVEIDGTKFYADTTPISQGEKPVSAGAQKTLRINYKGTEYTVHSAIYE